MPEIISLEYEHLRIHDVDALQQLIHARGIYDPHQLQAVMAEFWENHFTTDYDKTAEFLEEIEDMSGDEVISESQAEAEAAQLEYRSINSFMIMHWTGLGICFSTVPRAPPC